MTITMRKMFVHIISGCPTGMVAQKIKNRKLRIKKIGKIGNFALKNRRKIGKSKVLLSTKIASLHPIRVIIKAMFTGFR